MNVKRFIPWILSLLLLIPLIFTSYPSISWWNSGSYAAAAVSLGIPEPGGSILFILLGKVFTIIFFFLSTVKALILVSVVSSVIAAVLLYYSLLTIIDNINKEIPDTLKISAAFITAACSPFLFSIWMESTAVQVYSTGLLLTSLLVYCAVKIWFSGDDNEKKRYLYLAAFLTGLDFAAHRLNTPFIPVFLILLLFPLRKQLFKVSFWLAAIGLYLLGLSLNLYLLIRSPMFPAYAMDNIQNFGALVDWITMKRYGESNFSILFDRRAPFWDYQVNHMYLRYFGWNFLGTNGEASIFSQLYLSIIPVILGITGFIYSLIKRFKVWILLFTLFILYSLGLVLYSNIREGFDMIREIDRLFIPSFYIFLLFVGIGVLVIFSGLYNLLIKVHIRERALITLLLIFGFVLLPLNIFITNLHKCDNSRYFFPEDFGYNMLAGCGQNAILFTNGDNDSYPLWYLQTVEGVRPDITVINLPLLNTDFYVSQLQRKYKLFPENSVVFNPDKFRPSYIDSAVSIELSGNDKMEKGASDTLVMNYAGRDFGKKKGLIPQDKALIALLENNGWNRPIYFSITVAEDNVLGMSDHLYLTGFNRRLLPVNNDSVNYNQLRTNLLDKFRYRSFNDPSVYSDRTANMLFNNYRHLFLNLSQYYLEKGDKKYAGYIINEMDAKLPEWRFTDEQNREIAEFKKSLLE